MRKPTGPNYEICVAQHIGEAHLRPQPARGRKSEVDPTAEHIGGPVSSSTSACPNLMIGEALDHVRQRKVGFIEEHYLRLCLGEGGRGQQVQDSTHGEGSFHYVDLPDVER